MQMKQPASIHVVLSGWSPPRRSAVTIALAVAALVAFLCLLAVPLRWMPEPISSAAAQFTDGARVTVALTLVSGLAGLMLGTLAALARLARFALLRRAAGAYIWVIRGTPLLVQVLFVFLALPALAPSLQLSDFSSAVVALSFNSGAYNAEAIRSGILAVPLGQVNAARSLGLTAMQAFRYIVFPQSLRISLPSLVNNLVSLLKDSSLAYVIGVAELSNIGNRIQAVTFEPVPVFMTVAAVYLFLTTLLTQVSGAIERRLDVGAADVR
ncbi:MAG: amino acid ABC transporter permease [Burkholderiaceae bacterium]